MDTVTRTGIGAALEEPYLVLGGFADEAADTIEDQVAVTRALGWHFLEARSIDGINIHDLSERAFQRAVNALDAGDVRVSCFGSTIANWGARLDEEDFGETMRRVRRAIERMEILGVRLIRIMSYAVITDSTGNPLPDQRLALRLERLRAICGEFAAREIVPVHENCFNYGGMSLAHTKELLSALPDLRLVFDTGNPCLTPDYSKPAPRPNQEVWPAWQELKSAVAHLHIKDGWRDIATDEEHYVFPGQGPCRVEDILRDCAARGYGGYLSIEPHMAAVFHDASVRSSLSARRDNYLEYGHRLETILTKIGYSIEEGVAYARR